MNVFDSDARKMGAHSSLSLGAGVDSEISVHE